MALSQTQNRREREREERQSSILQAARQVFFSQGIHNATMDDVAAAAEVSKGTVYLYFQSKETILASLLLEGLHLLIKNLEIAFGANQPLAAEARLRRISQAYFDFFQAHPHYYRLLMAFERQKFQDSVEPELYEQILIRSNRGLAYVVQTIAQGVAEGDFVVEDAKQAAGVIWSMLHGVYVILGHPLRREILAADLEALYQAALELAIRGLRSTSLPAPR
jgi:AcrR family transcriptional regulator